MEAARDLENGRAEPNRCVVPGTLFVGMIWPRPYEWLPSTGVVRSCCAVDPD